MHTWRVKARAGVAVVCFFVGHDALAQTQIAADAVYEMPSAVGVDVALRTRLRDTRVGGAISGTIVPASPCCTVFVHGFMTLDFAVYADPHVSVFVGAAAGPTLFAPTSPNVEEGAALVATLDVALFVMHRVTFDVIVRGGGQIELAPIGVKQPTPLGELALGFSWDL